MRVHISKGRSVPSKFSVSSECSWQVDVGLAAGVSYEGDEVPVGPCTHWVHFWNGDLSPLQSMMSISVLRDLQTQSVSEHCTVSGQCSFQSLFKNPSTLLGATVGPG